MSEGRYYWIKLRTSFFDDPAMDFLLSQKNGAEYVILYLMLCTASANSGGRLETEIGDISVPYDVDKIVRDMKHFKRDTVVVALELFKKLGLFYDQEDEVLKISGLEAMIGSESASREAEKKRRSRDRKKIEEGTNLETKCPPIKGTKCPTENRDKRIENRDKSIDIQIERIDKEIKCEKSLFSSVGLSVEEYQNLLSVCSESRLREYMLSMQAWMARSNKKYKKPYETLISWIKRDSKQASEKASYDVEAFEEFAKDFDLSNASK